MWFESLIDNIIQPYKNLYVPTHVETGSSEVVRDIFDEYIKDKEEEKAKSKISLVLKRINSILEKRLEPQEGDYLILPDYQCFKGVIIDKMREVAIS